MAQFMSNLLTASIHGSVVILAVILLRLLLRKTPKKYICLLWLLAGIRLLMPIEIRSDLSLQPEFALPVDLNLPAILLWVWGVVAICFGIYSLTSYVKLKNKVREAIRIRGGWESDRIDTAFILGFIKPRIYIPMGMNHQARKYILEHERTHLDKGDHWIKMIGFLALALHWFNPLVWVAYILLCKDIEMACDERVVQFMELEERKSYSAALIACSSKQLHFSANPVAFGEVSVKKRILSVLNYKKPSFWISLLGVVAFFFVAVCLVTSPMKEMETVVISTEPTESTEQNLEETMDVLSRVQNAWDTVLSRERYHLFFWDGTNDGSVGWQVNIYKDGENTLWKSTDHMTEEGRMVLDGISYKLIDGGWVPFEEEDTMLEEMLAYFEVEGKELDRIASHINTREDGYTYETLTFDARENEGAGQLQPMTVTFDMDGNMTGMRVENANRKGADFFTFSDWTDDESGFNSMDGVFKHARENLLDVADVHPSKLQEPTRDEERMKEWGVLFRIDDDLLTRNSGEAWFAQTDGYEMPIYTDNEYWLEKQTDTGWEKMEMIAQPRWADASYTLSQDRYTMLNVDWLSLYGPLSSGKYRMGKNFYMVDAITSCVGYAEFDIYYNESNSADQKAAVERCYKELEELKKREHIHYLATSEEFSTTEVWWNREDFLYENTYYWTGATGVVQNSDGTIVPRVGRMARLDGVGYEQARKYPSDLSSEIIGMELSTLAPNGAGWENAEFRECLDLMFFERSNKTITFPEGIGYVGDDIVRFQQTWGLSGEKESATAVLTYKFDQNGDLYYMEYKTAEMTKPISIEIFDTTAAEIDAKIKPYTENLIVRDFSWSDSKAKYTDEEFNIRESGFVNTEITSVTDPVTAARLALKEYPNLGEYLSVVVFRDDTAGMWKVTIDSYVEYQSTHGYRDVYIADNGVTCLMVYEGPVGFNGSRK